MTHDTAYVSVIYSHSTHAPLYKRYALQTGDFEEVGVEGHYGPVHPETGAEYKALGGSDHRYSTDYKVGASYPKCTFIQGIHGGESLSHDQLRAVLEHHNLWRECLTEVILPRGEEHGELTWYYAYQFKPVERSPRLDALTRRLERRAEHEDYVVHHRETVEADLHVPAELLDERTTQETHQ